MAIDTKTPMALYKANLELVMRLGALLQENRQRWTRFGMASTDNAVERTLNETGRMLTTNDWKSLATLPGETFWKALQGDTGPMQGAVNIAVSNQAAFGQGLQDAFAAWQQQCADALQMTGMKLPGNATLEEFMRTLTPKVTAAGMPGPSAAARATPPAGKPKAPARKPKVPAKKPVKAAPAKPKAKVAKPKPKKKK